MTSRIRRLGSLWPFLALFLLVYLVNLGALRFVLDDWCQIPRLAGLMRGDAPGWAGIVDNRWLGSPRIFFLTWLLQGVWARIWGLGSSVPYFLLGFGAHLLSCLLIGRAVRRAGSSEDTATLAALACLVTPTSTSVLFWINCWQFILPVTSFLILVELYFCPARDRRVDVACLGAVAVCTQFLGEQILPVLYAGMAWALLQAWRQRDAVSRRRAFIRSAFPAAASAISLALYHRLAVAPYFTARAALWDWMAVRAGLRDLANIHAGAFSPFSEFYGKASVAPGQMTCVLVAAVAAVMAWRWLRGGGGDAGRGADGSPLPVFVGAAAVILLCQLPVLAGIGKGFRSMEYRYIYLSGLALAILLLRALVGIAGQMPGRGRGSAGAIAGSILVVYMSGLTIYDLRDIWGGHKRLEDRIWAQVDAAYRPEHMFIMTDGQTMAPLMPGRSNAIFDFKDDFGISCRMRATGKMAPGASLLVTRRYQSNHDHGAWMYLPAYRESVYRVTPDRILAVVFRYGPSYADMLAGDVRVFSGFDDYKRYRSEEQIRFVPWQINVP